MFVDQLRANSELIQEINDAFRDRSESLELISYYESEAMRGAGVFLLRLFNSDLGYCPKTFGHIGVSGREDFRSEWKSYGNCEVLVKGR